MKRSINNKCRQCELLEYERDKHKEEVRERKRKHARKGYHIHRELKLSQNAAYRSTPEALEAKRNRRKKYSEDPKFRINAAISSAIYRAITSAKSGRPWESITGYSLENLCAHLEKQFTKKINWSNFGEWHIDHIIPLSWFSYETDKDPDFKLAWALTNLRPLWGKENISKGGKRIYLI